MVQNALTLTDPAVPKPSDLADVLVDFLGCAVEDRQAIYVSTPITTGRRFVEWRRGAGADLAKGGPEYEQHLRAHVIEPNVRALTPIVRALRERGGGVVIDPTALDHIPGWEQHDYHDLWTRVIERYVKTVAFVDGWELSTGCVHELATALRVGSQILDQDLRPLAPGEAEARVRAALEEVADGVLPRRPLERALDELVRAEQEQGLGSNPER